MQRPFLLGYFDGDGSACLVRQHGRHYPNWSVCSGSEAFLVCMKAYILDSAGVVLNKIQHRKKSSLYQVMITGRQAWVLDEWLHQDPKLGLARKKFPVHITSRYLEPGPPTPAEKLAAAVRLAGVAGLSRKQISVGVFTCNKTKVELDAIVGEVLTMPGFGVEHRRTVGTHSARFLVHDGSQRHLTA